ncbi:fimbria/pilus outer membrane usher protein [Pantoea endophytica]
MQLKGYNIVRTVQLRCRLAIGSGLISVGCLLDPSEVRAGELYFDPYALDPRGGSVAADLSVFARGGQLPGSYRVDIFLNRTRIANRDISFILENNNLNPQLTVKDLGEMGVNIAAFPALMALGEAGIVSDLGRYIPEATAKFDFSQQRLDILVPQASLNFNARNRVDPALWDQGLPALLMRYNLTGSRNNSDLGGDTSNAFLSLRTGGNLGAWRLRNNSTFTYSKSSRGHEQEDYTDDESHARENESAKTLNRWQSINTYLQRDIQRIGGQLILGENSTSGMLFESLQFRGVQIASDDSMLPDSQRGFAPIVRGIANSSAQVTIRQNGNVIYQTFVAPGPFAIRDLYPTAGSGDLQVTVREEGGTENSFTQPFSSVPLMQREGRLRYEFTSGQYRSDVNNGREPFFAQGGLIYGLSNISTLYSGVIGSEDYVSAVAGVGQGLGKLGSISIDVTQAQTHLNDSSRHQGQSWRVQYAKDVFHSGTTFTLAGYRYSTSGFYDFKEANEISPVKEEDWRRNYTKRSKMQLQVSQTLGDFGSVYLNAYQQDYWGKQGYDRTFGGGYNVNVNGINLGLSVNNNQSPGNAANRQIALNLQVPLDRFLKNSWASFGGQIDNRHRSSQTLTVSGLALEDNNLSYAVRESLGNQGQGNAGGANLTYKNTYATVQSGYSYTRSSQQYTAGLQGGVVAHPFGVTLSQSLGETVTLVRAPGASGVKVQNQQGVRTDWRGYAVVPFASTYRENRVALIPDSLGDNVDITETVKTVVPTLGAIVLADFKTRSGSRALVTLKNQNDVVPFGASVIMMNNSEEVGTGIVGDNGEVYLSGVPDKATLRIKWGNAANQACQVSLSLLNAQIAGGVKILTVPCT